MLQPITKTMMGKEEGAAAMEMVTAATAATHGRRPLLVVFFPGLPSRLRLDLCGWLWRQGSALVVADGLYAWMNDGSAGCAAARAFPLFK